MSYIFKVGDRGTTVRRANYKVTAVGKFKILVEVENDSGFGEYIYSRGGYPVDDSLPVLNLPAKKIEGWINIYRRVDGQSVSSIFYLTKEEADKALWNECRVACVKVSKEYTPGEGLKT